MTWCLLTLWTQPTIIHVLHGAPLSAWARQKLSQDSSRLQHPLPEHPWGHALAWEHPLLTHGQGRGRLVREQRWDWTPSPAPRANCTDEMPCPPDTVLLELVTSCSGVKETTCCFWLLDTLFPWDYLWLPVSASVFGCPKASAGRVRWAELTGN